MIKAAIMGYGTVGAGVYEAVKVNQEVIEREVGEGLEIKRILDLRSFPGDPAEKLITDKFSDIEEDEEISLVVETMGGTTPAYEFVKAALLKGKHVVTSNKALVAAHGTELLRIAREKKVNFFFEAAVGGGIPVIRTLGTGYQGQVITEITGILNGTTNYILTRMDREGAEFGEVLADAQRLGYAERNPEADIEGHDTCRKIAILSSLVTGKEVNFEDVYTEGISKIDSTDFRYASELRASIKLVGSAQFAGDQVTVSVFPLLVSDENPLYAVHGVYNGIVIKGNLLGTTMLYGSGAGKLPTASAVLADMMEAGKHKNENVRFGWTAARQTVTSHESEKHRYFVRLSGDAASLAVAKEQFEAERVIQLPGLEEVAIVSAPMTEFTYRERAAKVPNILAMIRAELAE